MPNSCRRRRVLLVWHVRAHAIRLCVLCSSAAVRSINTSDGSSSSHQLGINAAMAVCTWHSVNSGFFPPELLPHPRQEQVTHRTQDQMAFQTQVTPALEM